MNSSPSSSSDSDEFNTRGARVFFGPLRTPEKSFPAFEETPVCAPRPHGEHASRKAPSAVMSPLDMNTVENDGARSPAHPNTLPSCADKGLTSPKDHRHVFYEASTHIDSSPRTADVGKDTDTASTSFPDLISFDQVAMPPPLPSPSLAPRSRSAVTVDDLLDSSFIRSPVGVALTSPPEVSSRDNPPTPQPSPRVDESYQTPKRKHDVAFPGAQSEARKKQWVTKDARAVLSVDSAKGPRRHRETENELENSGRACLSAHSSPQQLTAPRMLGSLSPESSAVLSNLLTGPTNDALRAELPTLRSPLPSLGASGALLKDALSTPSASPEIHTSAYGGNSPNSPKPTASPPRRVPVSTIFRTPSPVRRIPVPSPKKASPKPMGILASSRTRAVALPFPVTAAQSTQLQFTVGQQSPAKVSLPKSQLRQPSAGSRIPRPQAKPYGPLSSLASVKTADSSTAILRPLSPPVKAPLSPGKPAEPPVPSSPLKIRQVVPGMFNGGRISKDRHVPSSTAFTITSPSHSKSNGPIVVRQVIPGTLRHFESTSTSTLARQEHPRSPLMTPLTLDTAASPNADSGSGTALESPTIASPIALPIVPPIGPTVPANVDHSNNHASGLRRTGRSRKPTAIAGPSTQQAPRRRPPAVMSGQSLIAIASHGSEGLPMTAASLKALTTANTFKNQQVVAQFETLIVRREGKRPDSPTSKVKTILEKRNEERGLRAERRRQRTSGEGASSDVADGDSLLGDERSDAAEKEEASAHQRGHVRGPGDDEDYETPERLHRVDGPVKGVRWDPLLVWRESERTIAEQERMKGILTPQPRRNLVPGLDFVKERVVVQRFQYDDDPQPIEANSSPPKEQPPPKTKGRKKKT